MRFLMLLALTPFIALADWPQWRGPNFNGTAPAGDPPTQWSADKNIKWKIKLPGSMGAGSGFFSLVVIRFLFGAGEAGAFPNAARVISRWFPVLQRGRVQGLMLTAAQVGATASPALAGQLIEAVGWRWTFVAFGAVGVVWAVGFWLWFRDDPAAHPGVNARELAIIRAGDTLAVRGRSLVVLRRAAES